MNTEELTPLMKQYWELKKQACDALLLFRMGDFYELFGDDAIEASKILEITLTSRNKNQENPTPMAGVPHHSVQGYIQKLLNYGKKVAIAEQMEAAKTAVLVKREITRFFTPAVQFEEEGIKTSYLATAVFTNESDMWVLACMDPSTGETLVSDPITKDDLNLEIQNLPIKHFIKLENFSGQKNLPESEGFSARMAEKGFSGQKNLPESEGFSARMAEKGFSGQKNLPESEGFSGQNKTEFSLPKNCLHETLPPNYLTQSQASELLKTNYQIENLSLFFPSDTSCFALGVLLAYVLRTQKKEKLTHLRFPVPLHEPKSLILGPKTVQHLDLFPQDSNPLSLFTMINRTKSSLGSRQLRRWLLQPLNEVTEIQKRQKAVQELAETHAAITQFSEIFSQVYDLERISARINTRLASPRDTLAVGKTLSLIPKILNLMTSFQSYSLNEHKAQLQSHEKALETLYFEILKIQKEEAPITAKEGGIFKKNTHIELDRLIELTEEGQNWLIKLEKEEREKTGIPSLKVKYNRVFGYYIEVTQTHLKNVPAHYQRKQTMVSAERFFTEELKNFEGEILTASTRQKLLEEELFIELLQKIENQIPCIMQVAQVFGTLDALISVAQLTKQPGWVFPEIDNSFDLDIEKGRHPLVDHALKGAFVPNSTKLFLQTNLALIITGPNMGGKST
ncbi:MAG: DNA mismatch repair protein MutS, partial [Deltaproteobacteria bacterium]|nr:DNA mismatch repair protein MutS [Deltaproteobacteria bacterium]